MVAEAFGTMSQLALAPGSRRRNSYGRLSGEQWGHVPGLFGACLGPSTWVVAAGPVCLFQTPALPLFPISALASRASWASKRGPASQAPFPTSGCQGPEGPIVAAPSWQPPIRACLRPHSIWACGTSLKGSGRRPAVGVPVAAPLLCESTRRAIFLGPLQEPRS